MENHKGKYNIIITFAILFLAVSVLLALVFFAGKKTYVVRFDLNGGTLISGSLEQHITQGQDAVPPTAVKDGAYLRGWNASYRQITKDMVIEAIWEYETTTGIIYSGSQNQNYTEIIGSYEYLKGDVYLGAYYGDKKILGIRENAFSDREGITKVYLLDGLISIGESAFSGCTALREIEIPGTVTHLGKGAFSGCESLERIVLNEGLLEIGAGAFEGCVGLKEIVLPASLERIGAGAFKGCDDLIITVTHAEEKTYKNWAKGWQGSATVVWPDGVFIDGSESEEIGGIIKPVLRPGINFDDPKFPRPGFQIDPDRFKDPILDKETESEETESDKIESEETESEGLKRPVLDTGINLGGLKKPNLDIGIDLGGLKKPNLDIGIDLGGLKKPSLEIEFDTKPSLDTDTNTETESDTSVTSETEEE